MTELEVKLIKMDGGTQARAGTDRDTITEYIEALRESDSTWPFPPVVVYHDGDAYWLADGFHRITAAREHGRFVCEADVRQGTQRDAILHAAGANADHGLRRTAEDKKRAVLRLLEDAEWGKWSDREIARRCRVSPTFVGNIRKESGPLSTVDSGERVYTRNGEERVMNTAAIGGKPLPGHADMRKRLRQSLRDEMYATYQVSGITDADLRQVLSRDWGLGGGSSGPEMTAVYKKGGSNPGFWYNSYRDSGKPTLGGKELIVWVREVLELPYPQEGETAVSEPKRSPYYVGDDAQQPEIQPALDGYLRRTFSRGHLPQIIEALINRAHPDSDFRLNQASQALGTRPGHIRNAALVLKSNYSDYNGQSETAVSTPAPLTDTHPMPVWELEQLVKVWMSSVELKTPGITTPYQALVAIKEKHVGWRPTFDSIKATAPRLCNDGDLRQAINNVISRHRAGNDGNRETAVSPPTPDQIEGLVTRAANDVIDDGDLEDYAALYRRWLDDGPDDPDWHHLEKRTAEIPHGQIADALRNCYRRVAAEETAVTTHTMAAIMADVDAYEAEAAQLFAPAPAPRHTTYTDPRLAELNTALGIVTRLTANTSLTVDIVGPLAHALILMEDAKKALTKRQQYITWLRDYQDDDGRRWTDLSDSQTWHKNSPCFQAFVKAFPKEDFAKSALMDAKTQLERETAVVEVSA